MTDRDRDRSKANPRLKKRRKKICVFCEGKMTLDYKDIPFIRKFISSRGKILPRRNTGCCALHQRMVNRVVKCARQIGFLPYSAE